MGLPGAYGATPELFIDAQQVLHEAKAARATGVLYFDDGAWFVLDAVITALHSGMSDPEPLAIEESEFFVFDRRLAEHEIADVQRSLAAGRPTLPASLRSAALRHSVRAVPRRLHQRPEAWRDLGIDWPCYEVLMEGGDRARRGVAIRRTPMRRAPAHWQRK